MNVVILGIDHEIQKVDAWRSEEMKTAYLELVTSLIARYAVQSICEEADSVDETVGHQGAVTLGLPFGWTNIAMPEQARKEAGIFEEQMNRVPVQQDGTIQTHFENRGFYLDLKNGSHLFFPRVPSDAVREDYMFQQAIGNADDAESMLLLCGNFHVEEMARRFRKAGHTERTDAVYHYDWYDSEY